MQLPLLYSGFQSDKLTFSFVYLRKIEVFWCEGMQKLPPLYPFTSERTESLWVTDLEAGELNQCPQNVFFFFQVYLCLRVCCPVPCSNFQRWANEEDRVKILSEKHCRGAAAREVTRERKIKSGYVHKGEIRSSSWFYTSHIHF